MRLPASGCSRVVSGRSRRAEVRRRRISSLVGVSRLMAPDCQALAAPESPSRTAWLELGDHIEANEESEKVQPSLEESTSLETRLKSYIQSHRVVSHSFSILFSSTQICNTCCLKGSIQSFYQFHTDSNSHPV